MDITEILSGTIENGQATVARKRKPAMFALIEIKEVAVPYDAKPLADTPDKVAEYYNSSIRGKFPHNESVESFVVLYLNTRRRVIGHSIVSTGTLDTLLVHPREVFRNAIVANSAAIILVHNHPSGDPTPSEADIKVTRDLIRAGQLLKIEVLDHVIMGENRRTSLREMGYFY